MAISAFGPRWPDVVGVIVLGVAFATGIPTSLRAETNDPALWRFHGWQVCSVRVGVCDTGDQFGRGQVSYGLLGADGFSDAGDRRPYVRTPDGTLYVWSADDPSNRMYREYDPTALDAGGRRGVFKERKLVLTVDQSGYRKWITEFAAVLAPRFMEPADTLGAAGFDIGFEYSLSLHSGKSYWADGLSGYDRFDNVYADAQRTRLVAPGLPDTVKTSLHTIQFRFRKGLPFGMELGGNMMYLLDSKLILAGLDFKVSLYEGYREAPDVALRFSYNRSFSFGGSDLTLDFYGIDAGISYPFGLHYVELTPYGGYSFVLAHAQSEIQDPSFHPASFGTPGREGVDGPLFQLGDEAVPIHRIYLGLRMVVAHFTFAHETMITFNGVYNFSFKIGAEF